MYEHGKRDEGSRAGAELQRSTAGSPGKRTLTEDLGLTGSGGAPLPEAPRARLEASLDADLGGVRVHAGEASQHAAARLGARAFATGRDIQFAAGQLQPDSPAGLHLLAHEVAHTVQQASGAPGVQAQREVSRPGDAAEVEADRFADHIVHGGAMPALSPVPPIIHRQDATETGGKDGDFYTGVTTSIQQTLHDYENIHVRVPVYLPGGSEGSILTTLEVTVGVRYWNNKYDRYSSVYDPSLAPPPTYREANADHAVRSAAFTTYDKAVGDPPRFGTQASPAATAKGSPEEIRVLLQNAVDHQLIPAPTPPGEVADGTWWRNEWTAAIELWMQQVGVGVDCNGLVYQSLAQVQTTTGAQTIRQMNNGQGAYTAMDSDVGHASTENFGSLGEAILQMNIEPGDVMYLPGHVRIVMSVEQRDPSVPMIEFTTAESTADGRFNSEQTYDGPRTHYWKWVDGKMSQRFEGAPPDAWTELEHQESVSYHRHVFPPASSPPGAAQPAGS